MDKIKKLPVYLNNEVTAHLFYSYPLSIILSEPNLIPWYHENFIEISGFAEGNWYVILFDNVIGHIQRSIYSDVLEANHLRSTVLNKKNIIKYIINNIDCDHYSVILGIDRYYLRNSHLYMKNHDTREILFYGYNINKKTLSALDINDNKGMAEAEYYMEDIIDGYVADKITMQKNMSFFKIKYKEEYPFNIKTFNERLENYINGKYSKSELFFGLKHPDAGTLEDGGNLWDGGYHGINVYNYIFENEEKYLNGDLIFRYQMFHFLHQHKQLLYKKFKYISEKYNYSNMITYLEKLDELVVKFDRLRKYILKINYSDKHSFNYYVRLDKDRLYKIYNILSEGKDLEKNTLNLYLNNYRF